MGGEIGCQNAPEVRLGCSVRRPVVVGQVEVGDAEIEGSTADLALGCPKVDHRRSCATTPARWPVVEGHCDHNGGRSSSRSEKDRQRTARDEW